jgi:hypothetical protein
MSYLENTIPFECSLNTCQNGCENDGQRLSVKI